MKYSAKFTVEMPMTEFYKMAIPKVPVKELHKAVKDELYHTWNGIVSGSWGGEALDWREVFYRQLFEQGIIEQTKKSIDTYGKFN